MRHADAVGSLVGRQEELAQLQRVLGELAAGSAASVAITGEPGIGKTRLVAKLCQLADERGYLVLSGRAAEFERELPFAVFVDALDDYLGSLGGSVLTELEIAHAEELAHIFPAAGGGMSRGLEIERYRAHFAVRALLDVLGRRQPLVLALDDLHWADDSSTELLSYLVRRPPRGRVLIAVAFRPAHARRPLLGPVAQAEREGDLLRLELAPLTRDEANSVLGNLDRAAKALVYAESGGNPFYLEQLVRTAPAASATRIPQAERDHRGVPKAVMTAIADEIDRLPAPERGFLQAAAVAGDPFTLDLAAAVAGVTDEEGFERLDRLLALDLVRETAAPRSFHFRHPIARRAVYESTVRGWRTAAHRRAAESLRSGGAPALSYAHHVEQAATPGDMAAVEKLVEAGEAAVARAPGTAAHWFEAALRLLPGTEEHAERRLALQVRAATLLGAAGRIEESRDALRVLLETREDDLGGLRPRIAGACAMMEYLLRRHAQARRLLLDTLADVADGSSPEAASLKLELATISLWSGDHPEAYRWAQEAFAAGQERAEPALRAAATVLLGLGEFLVGNVSSARTHIEEAARLVDGLKDDELAPYLDSIAFLGWCECLLERPLAAEGHAERGLAVARATGQGHVVIPLLLGRTYALLLRGPLEQALEACDEAIEASLLTGSKEFQAWAVATRCWATTWAGNPEAAIPFGERARELSRDWEDLVAAVSGCYLAEALLETNQPERALEVVLPAAGGPDLPRIAPGWRTRWYELLTRIEVVRGHAEAAKAWTARAVASATGLGLAWATAWAESAQAYLFLGGARALDAGTAWLASADEFGSVDMLVWGAAARMLGGKALALAGEGDRAAAELERAHAELDDVGALALREEAAQELRRLGRHVPHTGTPGAGAGVDALSGREREVAQLVAAGKTNREIAAQLHLSPKTVERHLSRIFDKLGIHSRAALGGMLERASA